jgi:hypothetical protein
MLKKFGATAMILIMLVSFTIGSVSQASEPSKKYGNAMMYGPDMPLGLPLPAIGGMAFAGAGHTDNRFTSVILDLSGPRTMAGEGFVWHGPGLMPPFWGIHIVPSGDYIDGRMIITHAGSDTPDTFPVKFIRHQVSSMGGKAAMVSYMANTTIPLNEAGGSFLTFNGEIIVQDNNSVQFGTTALSDEGYNNEITMGQTLWHQAQVSGMKTAFNFDLKWNNLADNLRLMVYTPDGHVLGPYTDVSDGKTDGRINMEIDNQGGVADGTWLFKVTGTGVSGKDEYYIRTW